MTTLIERADAFAAHAHGSIGQRRKYTGEPYIEHPRAVASLCLEAGLGEEAAVVALLHDVVEDTPVTIEMIRLEFGSQIADRVAALTDEPVTPGRNRATRKAAARQRLAAADAVVQSVKLADLTDNARSIVVHDPQFAVQFLREMDALLEVLDHGSKYLQYEAHAVHADGVTKIHAPTESSLS